VRSNRLDEPDNMAVLGFGSLSIDQYIDQILPGQFLDIIGF